MARSSGFESGELSDVAVQVLLALTEPRHGYSVMQFLQERSDGGIMLGPASLYTTLKKLLATGFIDELDGDDTRRVYLASLKGRQVLRENVERRRRLLAMADAILVDALAANEAPTTGTRADERTPR